VATGVETDGNSDSSGASNSGVTELVSLAQDSTDRVDVSVSIGRYVMCCNDLILCIDVNIPTVCVYGICMSLIVSLLLLLMLINVLFIFDLSKVHPHSLPQRRLWNLNY
jgi:hypothetical protein